MPYKKPNAGEPIVLDIGDRKLELRFPLKALKTLDTEHHISVLKGEGLGDSLRDPAKLAIMLYYGLKTKQPDITLDWVEENVDARMLLDLAPMLAYATTGVFPDMDRILARLPNAGSPAEPLKEAGSTSGPLAATTSGVVN
jgi:hypothetical protein